MADMSSPLLTSAIIDLFGGVRPMAKQLDMAASTVQGWKLRQHIPANYHDRLREVLDPDMRASFDALWAGDASAIALIPNDIAPSDMPLAEMAASGPIPLPDTKEHTPKRPASAAMPRDPNAAYFNMPQAHLRYWVMSSLATLGGITLVTLVLLAIFFGKDIFEYFEHPATPAPVIVETRAAPVVEAVAPQQESLAESRAAIAKTLDNVQKIKAETPSDQTKLVEDINTIEQMVSQLRDRVDALDKTMRDKGVDTDSIRSQISQISKRDVMAAALLLGVAQIHGIMDREASYQDDLDFLKIILADDPEMVASLNKLGPFAEKAIMTREEIMDTLQILGKETLAVSVTHPELSWTDRFWLALDNVIQIKKKTPVTTTTTATAATDTPQGQIKQAQNLVAQDQYDEAALVLQDYQGPQADVILTIAQNLQARAAAGDVLQALMQKSQQLLDLDQLKNQFETLTNGNTTLNPAFNR